MAHPDSTPTRRDLTPALIALAARAESVLERLLPADTQAPVQLHRAMRYSTLGGGTRLRPWLAYGTRLRIECQRELMGDNGLGMFACRLLEGDAVIATANVSVFEPPDPTAYLSDPNA